MINFKLLATSFLLAFSSVHLTQAAEKPNIIFILVDDMGWSDIGCYGSEIKTPNIDSLANNGIRFTQFYNTAKFKSTKLEDFGTIASFETVGKSWATVQNTPLRKWKNYSHEGGIRTPLVVSWPAKIKSHGGYTHQPGHLIDVMATVVELSGATYPKTFNDRPITPMQGVSLLPAMEGKPLKRGKPIFWQWSAGGAIRDGDMKAVFWGKKASDTWELYDLSKDLNESDNLAKKMPEKLTSMKQNWQAWYEDVSAKKSKK
jgi:arylsulfatase